jgi:hypothetical protein
MMFRWRYFAGAVILAAVLLLQQGAPPAAVFAGIAGAAIFAWLKFRATRPS